MSNLKGTIKTALFLAFKDLSQDKVIVTLVVFVVAFGFLFFGISTGLGDGFYNAFKDELIDTLTSHIVIEPVESSKLFDYDSVSNIEQKLDLIPGISGYSPHLKRNARIIRKDRGLNVEVMGLTPSKESMVTDIPDKVTYGEFLDDDDTDEIVLGIQLTNIQTEGGFQMTQVKTHLDVEVGDKVTVAYKNGVTREYRVKGVLEGGVLGSDWFAYVTNKEMKSVYGEDGGASEILVRLQDAESVDKFRLLIMQQGIHGNVKTWKENIGFIENVTASLGMFTSIITAIGLATTIITVTIVIYINSSRKRRLTGVLKAIGAQSSVVLIVYLIEALVFGIFGIFAGIGMSYAADAYVKANPIHIPIGDVFLNIHPGLFVKAGLCIMVASALSGFYPAWKASRQDIIKSIWEE